MEETTVQEVVSSDDLEQLVPEEGEEMYGWAWQTDPRGWAKQPLGVGDQVRPKDTKTAIALGMTGRGGQVVDIKGNRAQVRIHDSDRLVEFGPGQLSLLSPTYTRRSKRVNMNNGHSGQVVQEQINEGFSRERAEWQQKIQDLERQLGERNTVIGNLQVEVGRLNGEVQTYQGLLEGETQIDTRQLQMTLQPLAQAAMRGLWRGEDSLPLGEVVRVLRDVETKSGTSLV